MDNLNRKYEYYWCLVLCLVGFFSFYFALGAYPLFDNNEGLYASIAKYMLLSKEFIIPHLNGVPYIEKPPLLYWLLSLSFSGFGFSAFAARLVTVTSAALVFVVMILFTKKIKQPKIGIMGSLIFASSVGVSIIARMVYFDMLFTFLISGALFCLFYWNDSQNKTSLRVAYLFLGLAVLAKGLIALVLICGSFGLFLIIEKKFRRFYQILDPAGIALFLAIVVPWHIAAIMRHKGFAWQYFVEEHFLRFLDQREPHDYYHGPIYYYLPRIMVYLFPWSFFIPLVFLRTKGASELERKLLRFSWCWLLVPLIFFSLSSAKANYYMIVSVPALAIMLGIKISHFAKNKANLFSIWVAVIFFIITLVLSVEYFTVASGLKIDANTKRVLIAAIFYGLLAGTIIMVKIRKQTVIMALLAAFIIPISVVMISYIKAAKDDLSSASAGIYLSTQAENKPLYLYQDFENVSALAFYAPACFKIIDSKSNDLYYGEHLPEFKQQFVNKEKFLQETINNKVYIVVPVKKLSQFYQAVSPEKFSVVKKFNKLEIVQLK
ncbi:MAG: glycosyltransferase family 39 protein [Gammaproteobacteria bacterium]|nr:glycosyltransferase family 39 protein [Gammaproteobacteria bacterium]